MYSFFGRGVQLRRLNFSVGTIALSLIALPVVANATVYDLNADWSNSNNPNGAWSYREGVNLLPAVASWQSTLGGWGTAQPGWAYSENGNNRLPFIFKSNGSETFGHDWSAGDVLMHSTDGANGVGSGPGNVAWTSQFDGVATITGSAWLGRDIGRAVDWKLFKNASLLTSGHLADGDPYSKANPFDFAAGSGGAGVLANIAVNTGDQLILQLETVSSSGEFVGMNYTINATPVPEPATLAAIGMGVTVLLKRRKRRA